MAGLHHYSDSHAACSWVHLAAGIVGGITTGIAKNVTIYSVRVLDDMGSGTIATLIDGLNHVTNSKLPRKIASMSLGGGLAESLNKAVEAAVKAGVLVIVAAGNEDTDACEVSPGEHTAALAWKQLTRLLIQAHGCVHQHAPTLSFSDGIQWRDTMSGFESKPDMVSLQRDVLTCSAAMMHYAAPVLHSLRTQAKKNYSASLLAWAVLTCWRYSAHDITQPLADTAATCGSARLGHGLCFKFASPAYP